MVNMTYQDWKLSFNSPNKPIQILLQRFRAQVSASMPVRFHESFRDYLMSSLQIAGQLCLQDEEAHTSWISKLQIQTFRIQAVEETVSPIPSSMFVTDAFAPSLNGKLQVLHSLDGVELEEWLDFVANSNLNVVETDLLAYQQQFLAMCKTMATLGLGDLLFAEAETLLYNYVEDQAFKAISKEDEFERGLLRPCLCWLQKALLPWLELVVSANVSNAKKGTRMV